jgi:hypothetical protein
MPLPPLELQRILDKLDEGALSVEAPTAMYASYARDRRCDGCDETIHSAEVQYEMHYGGDLIRMHLGCMGLWESECRGRGARSK